MPIKTPIKRKKRKLLLTRTLPLLTSVLLLSSPRLSLLLIIIITVIVSFDIIIVIIIMLRKTCQQKTVGSGGCQCLPIPMRRVARQLPALFNTIKMITAMKKMMKSHGMMMMEKEKRPESVAKRPVSLPCLCSSRWVPISHSPSHLNND